ncbi:flagellin N-terminal helical domain-containing protein [Chitinasiproducens palmae]|uniref:Flagellin N-terminal helical region n=1 Tax=Chitinasiproducens palmae TaxID=1770053 RepID=A0A1H2PKS8_9BURK|nr:hypothetical protein [Chitinasiproducens palmae]SDV46958.1 flagellin N-terminal helical region [Chitinasiproducens palmae]
MRITSYSFARQQMTWLNATVAAQQRAILQMNTGQRLLRWSDDPGAAQAVDRLVGAVERGNSYLRVVQTLAGGQERAEAGMRSLIEQLDVAVARLTGALNDDPSSGTPQIKARALAEVRDQVLSLVNTADIDGRAIFAGTARGTHAVRYDAAAEAGKRYAYVGNNERNHVAIDVTQVVETGQSLPEVADLLNMLDVAIAALEAPAGASGQTARRALEAALEGTRQTQDAVGGKVADLGYLRNVLDAVGERHQTVGQAWQEEAVRLGGIDQTALTTELSQLAAAGEMLRQIYAHFGRTTLFDYVG